MICPYCNRKPSQIPEYTKLANLMEINSEDYVRIDEGTYHPETNLFCCSSCYIEIGTPLNKDLFEAFRLYRQKVVSFV